MMKNEKGAVMVETIIIFPIVMLTVFFLLYLGLVKLQDMAILYQVQRTAHQGSMVLAGPGYQELGTYDSKQIDFTAPPADVDAYYKAYHQDIGTLYREIFGCGGWTSQQEMQSFLEKMGDDTMVLAGVSLFEQKATVHRGLLSTRLDTEVTFGFHAPGVFRYFGYEGEIRFKQGARATAVHPATVVRTVDLASDALVLVSGKLGIEEDLSKIMNGIKKYLF